KKTASVDVHGATVARAFEAGMAISKSFHGDASLLAAKKLFGGHSRRASASAAAKRSAAHRAPGRRPIRSIGPDTDTAAITAPRPSRTGAETLATPASRSAALCAQPRLRTSARARSVNIAAGSTACWVAASA